MMQKILLHKMSESIRPLCPRDSRVMHYDAKGVMWTRQGENENALPSYRCGYQGCSVRYTPLDGYFSLIQMPDLPQAVEEPGVNLLQCPRHETWLYRTVAQNVSDGLVWCCGVAGCDYTHANCGPTWPAM